MTWAPLKGRSHSGQGSAITKKQQKGFREQLKKENDEDGNADYDDDDDVAFINNNEICT